MTHLKLALLSLSFIAGVTAVAWFVYVDSLTTYITCDGKEKPTYLIEYWEFSNKERGTLTNLYYYPDDYHLEKTRLRDVKFNIDSIVWREPERQLILTRNNLKLRENGFNPYETLATYQCKLDPDYAARIKEHQSLGRDGRQI
jgi:uncharacterized protein (UPF0297 family)